MTAFTDLVGCRLPLQLASLGGPIGTPALAAAVSGAGGLGTIPNPSSAADVENLVGTARAATSGPIGVGFLIPFVARDAVEAAAATADVVEFFYGDPDPDLVRLAGAHGACTGWQVGSAAEARAAVAAGCQFVMVQGIEGGGHVRGRQGLDELLAQTLETVEVPVVAAGGVGTAERLIALLDAGAAAVRVGTRFVATEESDAHPDYVARLVAASAGDTVLTGTFNIGWPDAPHRVLKSAVDAAESTDRETVGTLGGGDIPRLAPVPPTRATEGEIGAMALYAGESVGAVTRVQPAADVVAELTAQLADTG
jgi:NAD(P)H-dependent flavin oxidoreductase YrpB (nitropropane dioxygenase family)